MSGTVAGNLISLVLSGAQRQGADPRVLVREAGLPGWAFEDKDVRFPTAGLARLWQVSAARLEDPRFGLRVAAGWRLGACDVYDYIFDPAASLGDAFTAAFKYTPLLNSAGIGMPPGAGEDPARGRRCPAREAVGGRAGRDHGNAGAAAPRAGRRGGVTGASLTICWRCQ